MMQELNFNNFSPSYLVPPLQMITAARICTTVYINDDLIDFLVKQPNLFGTDNDTWFTEKVRIKQLLGSLILPESLKNMVIHFSDRIGDEISEWVKCNDWILYRPDYGESDSTYPLALHDYFHNCFIWTSRGTVHYDKTARNILRSEFVTVEEQFHLACDYCFEDILSYRFVPKLSQYDALSSEVRSKKPWVCYWVFHFFPEILLELKKKRIKCFLENIDHYQLQVQMLLIAKNDVALRYIFDRLDLITKEQVIENIIHCCDFEMKTYLLSQISAGTRAVMLEQKSFLLILNELTNILWKDCVIYYFNTYGSMISCEQGITILNELFRDDKVLLSIKNNHSKQLFVFELWTCLSKNVKTELIVECFTKKSFGLMPILYDLPKILSILLHFDDTDLIKELFMIAENETIKLKVSSTLPNCENSFTINSEFYKNINYYPNPARGIKDATANQKLYLVHEFMISQHSDNLNPLMLERLQNNIIDVFVEYCRFGQVSYISTILQKIFREESERISYKSSIFDGMFNKLLKKAVYESHYYWETSATSFPTRTPIRVRQLRTSKRDIYVYYPRKDEDPFITYGCLNEANSRLDRRIKRQQQRESAQRKTAQIHNGPSQLTQNNPLLQLNDSNTVNIRGQNVLQPMKRYSLRHSFTKSQSSRLLVIYDSDNNHIIFSAIDSFLNWHFSSPKQVEEFKANTIFHQRLPIIETLLKENNTLKLQQLLRWFLSYDDEKIDTFKSNCPRNVLTSLLEL